VCSSDLPNGTVGSYRGRAVVPLPSVRSNEAGRGERAG